MGHAERARCNGECGLEPGRGVISDTSKLFYRDSSLHLFEPHGLYYRAFDTQCKQLLYLARLVQKQCDVWGNRRVTDFLKLGQEKGGRFPHRLLVACMELAEHRLTTVGVKPNHQQAVHTVLLLTPTLDHLQMTHLIQLLPVPVPVLVNFNQQKNTAKTKQHVWTAQQMT